MLNKYFGNLKGKYAASTFAASHFELPKPFGLTLQEILYKCGSGNSKECAISGVEIFLDKDASLDRIDSSKGYTKDNVWWVHRDVNMMKRDHDLDKFLLWCETITNHRKETN